MRILFANRILFDGSTRGGAQQSTRDLCYALKRRNIETSILGALAQDATVAVKVTHDDGIEHVCAKNVDAQFPILCDRFNPDLVVLSSGDIHEMVQICLARALPAILYLRGARFDVLKWTIPRSPQIGYLANSPFVARMLRATFGLSVPVIPSLVARSRYRVTSTRERVTFINPVPAKGVHLAYALARARPQIPFTFVEGWKAPEVEDRWLRQALASAPNVELHPRVDDMRVIYGRTKVLLAPSTYEDSAPRVVTEAQFNGIPVLGTARGALPESIGPGGIVVGLFAPIERWAAELDRLWTDASLYERLSDAARLHATRAEIAEDGVADAFVFHVGRFLAGQRLPVRHPAATTATTIVPRDVRPRSAKVLGVGLSRTGTSSLTRALENLGLSAIHYPKTLDHIRAHDAATDLPVAAAFEDLDAMFPGSRFVYTVRPLDTWLKSCEAHFPRHRALPQHAANTRFALFGRIDYDRDAFARAYIAHDERVRTYFKDRPADLLTIDLTTPGDHWDELCCFLGRSRPTIAFPWLNRRSHVEALVKRLHGHLGDVDAVARVLAVSPEWVAMIVANDGGEAATSAPADEDEGMVLAYLIGRVAKHFGGVAAAAGLLRIPEAVVYAAVERVCQKRRQIGDAK